MKDLLKRSETRQMAVLIGFAIALGITVHQIFLVVAQVLTVATCAYLMIVTIHARRAAKQHGQLG